VPVSYYKSVGGSIGFAKDILDLKVHGSQMWVRDAVSGQPSSRQVTLGFSPQLVFTRLKVDPEISVQKQTNPASSYTATTYNLDLGVSRKLFFERTLINFSCGYTGTVDSQEYSSDTYRGKLGLKLLSARLPLGLKESDLSLSSQYNKVVPGDSKNYTVLMTLDFS